MGVDITLYYANEGDISVPSHVEGSNVVIGGSTEASMSITYNYSKLWGLALRANGHKWQGMLQFLTVEKAGQLSNRLAIIIDELGLRQNDNYWLDTPGNAGHIASVLLKWCELHPQARVEVWG